MRLQKKLWLPVLVPTILWFVSTGIMYSLTDDPLKGLALILVIIVAIIVSSMHALATYIGVKHPHSTWIIHGIFFCVWAYPLSSALIWAWRSILIALFGHY